MKITIAQTSPVLGNLEANFAVHQQAIEQAMNQGSHLIVFPELSLSGYQLKDWVEEMALTPNHRIFTALCRLSEGIDILVGAPWEEPSGIYYNAALYFAGGGLWHLHKKVQLPNYGMFEEGMIFKAGDTFIPFERFGHRIGILICREILFPMNPYLLFLQNTDFIIGISNSPYRGISQEGDYHSLKLWERMGEVCSIHFHQHYLFVNRTGFEDGIGFGGGSFYAPPGQAIRDRAPYYEPHTMVVSIDADMTRRARLSGQFLRDDKPQLLQRELKRILND
jgi:predicted amidohydrolase